MPSPSPRRIGRYEIVRELGRGMMGVVYEARDPVLGRRIALKTIHLSHLGGDRQRQLYERRFLAEAQAAGQLSDPGIVVVHDVGRDAESGLLFIALEFLIGRPLSDLMAESALPDWRQRMRVVARVARALHHAHSHGVVHRDIKPANIMILPSGEPKIMDFGIAKIDTSELTTPGEIFGTPLYMAPEQALGEKVDARSDLFSLGSITYVLLTGRPPFAAQSVPGILAKVAHQHPPLPSEIKLELPKELDYLVARAMAKAPDQRYPDGQAMAEDIEDIIAREKPRHRAGWVMPERGEGTVFAQSPPRKEPAPSPAPPPAPAEEKAVRPPRRFGATALRLLRVVGATRLAAFVVASAFVFLYLNPHIAARLNRWLMGAVAPRIAFRDSTARRAIRADAAPTPAPVTGAQTGSAAAALSPVQDDDGGGEIDDIELPPDAEKTGAAPDVEPVDESEPSDAVYSKAPGVQKPARLQIVFEHGLKSGRINVWIDGKAILSENLDSRVTHKFLVFTSRKGTVFEALKLAPGRHVITAQVRWDGKTKTGGLRTTLKAGSQRCLEVILHRDKLLLRWRY